MMLYNHIIISEQEPWDWSKFLCPEKISMLIWWASFTSCGEQEWTEGSFLSHVNSSDLCLTVAAASSLLSIKWIKSRIEKLCFWCRGLIKFCGWILKKRPGQSAKMNTVPHCVLFYIKEKQSRLQKSYVKGFSLTGRSWSLANVC